jgi:hypothetical protein
LRRATAWRSHGRIISGSSAAADGRQAEAQRTEDLIVPLGGSDDGQIFFRPSPEAPPSLGYRLLELLNWFAESGWRMAALIGAALLIGSIAERRPSMSQMVPIEAGIPLPPRGLGRGTGGGCPRKYAWAAMKVGDSFAVPASRS